MDTTKIFKFSGREEDFDQWKDNFVSQMIYLKLGYLVDPEENKPDTKPSYKDDNWVLIGYIRASMPQGLMVKVKSFEKNGIAAWKWLCSKYERTDRIQAAALREKLSRATFQDGGDVEIYIENIKVLAKQIGVIEKVNFPDEAIMGSILRGLPDSFKEFKRSKTIQKDLTLQSLETELISIVNAEREVKIDSEEFSYSAKSKFRHFNHKKNGEKYFKKDHFKKSDKETICFECHKPGHKRIDCFQWKKGQKKEFKSKANSAAYVAMKEVNFVADTANKALAKDIWIIDSGASSHICNDKDLFVEMNEFIDNEHKIGVGNGEKVQVMGKGIVKLIVYDSKRNSVTMALNEVLYAPGMDGNFISFKKILRMGHVYDFDKDGNMAINVHKKGEILIPTGSQNDIITLDVQGYVRKEKREENLLMVSKETGKLELWHKRLGHIGKTNLKKLIHYVDGVDFSHDEDFNCEICAMTKMTPKPFTKSVTKTTKPLQLIHCDIAGPLRTPTKFFEERYAILFIDDYSHEIHVYTMKYKNEALEKFKQFRADVQKLGFMIQCIRTDNGGEFISKVFKQFCKDNGIRQEWTIPYTPQQNGVAERTWRTLFEMTRSMLKESNLGDEWWGRAMKTAAYIKNRCLTSGTDEMKTPYELCYGKKPDLSEMRIFGCQVYAHEPPVGKYYKLDNRAKPGLFMGYSENVKGTLVYLPKEDKVIISRTVKFLENSQAQKIKLFNKRLSAVLDQIKDSGIKINFSKLREDAIRYQDKAKVPEPEKKIPEKNTANEHVDNTPEAAEDDRAEEDEDQNEVSDEPLQINAESYDSEEEDEETTKPTKKQQKKKQIVKTRGKYNLRNRVIRTAFKAEDLKTSENLEETVLAAIADGNPIVNNLPTPADYREASKDDNWRNAMKEEYDSLVNNDTWELVELPPGRKAIRCKWVYKIKQNSDGTIAKYKARLVAKGFTQKEGIDFNETYAPVTKMTTIKSLISIATIEEMNIKQMDFSTAFLNSDLAEEIYMVQPAGFEFEGENGRTLVCKLKRALYGLKQAGRNWNKMLDKWLKEYGFIASQIDPCLYILRRNGSILMLAVYVDDIISADNDPKLRQEFIKKIGQKFKIVDLGDAKWVLATKLERTKNGTHLHQEKYLNDIFEKFGMEYCKEMSTPVVPRTDSENEAIFIDKTLYMRLVGCLIYLSVVSRPDIAYAVGKLSQKMSNPTQADWIAAKRILRYLKKDKNTGPIYAVNGSTQLVGYCDSDWGGDLETRRSTSGYVFLFGGAAISWCSKRQATVALSSAEAEYMAVCSAVQEAIYLRALLKDFGYEQNGPTTIYQDNQGSIAMSKNAIVSRRTKHIDIKYHYVREMVEAGHIKLEYLPTSEMIADCLTKPVTRNVYEQAKIEMLGNKKDFRLRESVAEDNLNPGRL